MMICGQQQSIILEKWNLIVACLGYLGLAGKIHAFMINARTRMMSWVQHPVSMFVDILSYTVLRRYEIAAKDLQPTYDDESCVARGSLLLAIEDSSV